MIKELIFILIIVVAILIAIATSGPTSILKEESPVIVVQDKPKQNKKNTRVRFSPEKKERTYSVKTGKIIGDSVAPVGDIESTD